GGVSTQTNRSSQPATSATSSVNESRSRLRSRSSGTPSSWNGTSPRRSASTFSRTTSRITTSCPSSARQTPVTRPTQPAPKIPTFAIAPTLLLGRHGFEALRDRDHRLVRERVEERVHDPVAHVADPQHDHVQVRPRVVELELAAAEDVLEAAVGEHRGVRPVRLLDPPELARPRPEDHPHRLVAALDPVEAHRLVAREGVRVRRAL